MNSDYAHAQLTQLRARAATATQLEVSLADARRENAALKQALERQRQDAEDCLRRERAARRALEQTNDMKDRALRSVAQELRAPIQMALGWTQLLLREPLAADGRATVLDRIRRCVLAQRALVDEIFDLPLLASTGVPIAITPVDLRRAAATAVEHVRPVAHSRGVAIELNAESDPSVVFGDPRHIERMLIHLMKSALKSIAAAGPITVTLTRNDAQAVVRVTRVSTDGPLPNLRTSLVRPLDATTQDDAAFDLDLAKRLAAVHGGTVDVEIEAPSTAAFVLQFEATRPNGGGEPEPRATNRGALSGVKILVVDDDEDTREILGALLSAQGAISIIAGDCRTATAIAAVERPDVVVSDLSMPEEDGATLARRLRSYHDAISLIAISGLSMENATQRISDGDFDAYLAKPTDGKVLIETIKRSLALRSARG